MRRLILITGLVLLLASAGFHLAAGEKTVTNFPATALFHTEKDEATARSEAKAEIIPGEHAIGFRIVQAPLPAISPLPYEPPLVQQFVKQSIASLIEGDWKRGISRSTRRFRILAETGNPGGRGLCHSTTREAPARQSRPFFLPPSR